MWDPTAGESKQNFLKQDGVTEEVIQQGRNPMLTNLVDGYAADAGDFDQQNSSQKKREHSTIMEGSQHGTVLTDEEYERMMEVRRRSHSRRYTSPFPNPLNTV